MRGKAGIRQLTLFTLACCRRLDLDLADPRSRQALDVAEGRVDGSAGRAEFDEAFNRAKDVEDEFVALLHEHGQLPHSEIRHSGNVIGTAICLCVGRYIGEAVETACYVALQLETGRDKYAERRWQARILSDIIGDPFRPVSITPSRLTPSVTNLAIAAYDERILPSGELDPARLAVLSDALEEAGCTDADLLDHLRSPGPHVRGCWVLDSILGRS